MVPDLNRRQLVIFCLGCLQAKVYKYDFHACIWGSDDKLSYYCSICADCGYRNVIRKTHLDRKGVS